MTAGSPVGRQWLVIRKDGTPVVDWGDGLYQDISTGIFFKGSEKDISHTISDDELKQLQKAGVIYGYDDTQVYISLLPDRPTQTLD